MIDDGSRRRTDLTGENGARWSDDVDALQLRGDRAGVAAYLASADLAADLAALLRRWTEPGRPALLVVLDWDTPFAEVYPERELIETFPDVPVVPAGLIAEVGPGRLLVVVVDEAGEAAYVIPDPRAAN
jgi:hypothetical protein